MAIGARTRPELIVLGTVTSTRRNTWEGEDRGDRVTVDTEGGPLVVGYQVEQRKQLPSVGTIVALVTSVYDGARGSSLSFEREVSANELDQLASAANAA